MRPMGLPQGDLGHHLPFRRVSFGEEAFELGQAGHCDRKFGAIVSIKDYPAIRCRACSTNSIACLSR
jgi:type IV secretion system protein VirB4